MKIKKAFDICKKNKIISIFGNEKGEHGCQTAMRSILFSACRNSMKITYANSMTSTMRREIRLDLQSVKPSR